MLHDHKVSFVFERNTDVSQESVGRLTHDHGAEELTAKPSATPWRYRSLNDGNLEIRTSLAKHVGSTKTTRSSTDNDDVGLGVCVEILEVTTSHGTADLRLSDGSECEALVPLLGHFLEGLGLGTIDWE